MYSYIIFDLDGTLLDTLPDIQWALNTALAEFGQPVHNREAVRRMVGHGLAELVRQATGADRTTDPGIQALAGQVTARLRAIYREQPWRETLPYPGIPELLARLKDRGLPLGLLTNKAQPVADLVAGHFFPGIFQVVRGESPELPRKPDPAALHQLLDRLEPRPAPGQPDCRSDDRASRLERTVLVGDSDVDLLTARQAGCASIGVLWGFRSRAELEAIGPTCLARDSRELASLLGL